MLVGLFPINLCVVFMSVASSLMRSRRRPRGVASPAWHDRSRSVVVATSVSIVAILLSVGLLIAVRRLTGALTNDLPRSMMLLIAIGSTAILSSVRTAWRRSFPLDVTAGGRASDLLIGWGSSLALLLLATGSCFPTNRTSDWLIWLPLLVADQLWRQTFFDAGKPWRHLSNFGSVKISPLAASDFAQSDRAAQPQDEKLVQRLFRLRDDHGRETIYGTLRADFQPGQRTAVVHIGFCPPLDYLPEIEAEPLEGFEDAKIKIVQSLAHGARLDIRLAEPAEDACRMWIDLAATPPGELPQPLRA